MSAPGLWEWVFLAVLALLIFGPEKLPGMAKSVGKTINTFKREAQSTLDELKRSAELEELNEIAGDLRSTTADLKRSASLTGPVASSAGAAAVGSGASESGGEESPVHAALPAPFDPDAT
jgi:TatA/E family protein of Tat protein translocase